MNQDTKHSTLLMVRGMPGSGKSYFAAELQNAIGLDRVVMLDPDTIDFQSHDYLKFTETPFALEVDPKIQPFRYLKSQAFDGIASGKIIIWNQPFTNRGMFDRLIASLQDYASDHGVTLSTLLVEVTVDAATSKERVQQRIRGGGHGPSDDTLDKRIRDYESFADTGYETVSVDGTGDIAVSVATVREAMNRLQPLE